MPFRFIGRRQLADMRGSAGAAHAHDRPHRKRANFDFFIYAMILLIVAFSFRLFFVDQVRVMGVSMEGPMGLHDGERILMEKVSLWFSAPARGDIIICYYPNHAQSCVKRVIGIPGDMIEIRGGRVYLNGKALNESAYWQGVIYGDLDPVIIDKNEVFVMGDNRNNSGDSRDLENVGPIPYARIVGRAWSVVWPAEARRGLK